MIIWLRNCFMPRAKIGDFFIIIFFNFYTHSCENAHCARDCMVRSKKIIKGVIPEIIVLEVGYDYVSFNVLPRSTEWIQQSSTSTQQQKAKTCASIAIGFLNLLTIRKVFLCYWLFVQLSVDPPLHIREVPFQMLWQCT